MILEQARIKQSQKWLRKITRGLKERSNWCQVLADPTRVKIILLLKKHKELCVSDLAQILGISISAVSHQLSVLERYNLVNSKKMGKVVCYLLRIEDKRIFNCLEMDFHSNK